MTKFQIMSDLHQEFYDEEILKKEDIVGEALLLAGDICNQPSKIAYLTKLKIPVFYIAGNHEYYGWIWENVIPKLRTFFEKTNVTFMERDTVIHNGVRIIAATLWTDFMAPAELPADQHGNKVITAWEHQGAYCYRGMNDLHVIKNFNISKWEEYHKLSLGYIKEVLSQYHDGPTIVMTHHCPSFKSVHPRYAGSSINGGFAVNLDYLIEEYQPDLWIHGHTHTSFDYNIGKTRILCNPRGYHAENYEKFKYNLTVEL